MRDSVMVLSGLSISPSRRPLANFFVLKYLLLFLQPVNIYTADAAKSYSTIYTPHNLKTKRKSNTIEDTKKLVNINENIVIQYIQLTAVKQL